MTHAQLPDPEDLQTLYRLIHELCEMGEDAYAWRAHLFSVLLPMLDTESGTAYVMKHPVDPSDIGPRMPLSMNISGSEFWWKYVEQGDFTENPINPGIMARIGTDFTCTRQELVDDETWYSSPFPKNVATPAGWDEILNSQVAVVPSAYVSGLGFFRAPGKPAFGPYEVNIVHFVHAELGRLWRRPDPVDINTLPKRQREVLDGIRRGEPRKVIAEKMKVSSNTVHGYEKALFVRAGVNSRGELLARLAKYVQPNLLP